MARKAAPRVHVWKLRKYGSQNCCCCVGVRERKSEMEIAAPMGVAAAFKDDLEKSSQEQAAFRLFAFQIFELAFAMSKILHVHRLLEPSLIQCILPTFLEG